MIALATKYYNADLACALHAGAKPLSDGGISSNLAVAVASQIDDRVMRSYTWGFFDVENVAKYGYDRPVDASYDTHMPSTSIDEAQKCDAAAAASVNGIVGFPDEKSLPDGGPRTPIGDSRYKAVVKTWSKCMAGRGFAFPDPLAAIGDTIAKQESAPPGPNQASPGVADPAGIAVASADVKCKISTNLVGVAVALQTAYDNEYINSHATELADYRSKLAQALR